MNRGSVLWSAIEVASSAFLSFVSAFVLARLIGPAELGIGAAIVSAHVLLWVVVNALFADALVQRESIDDSTVSSAFWAAVVVGIAAMLAQAGAGWVLERVLSDARLLPMAVVLAVPLPLVGAGGVMQGVLTRRRAYRHLAMRSLLGQGIGTAVGVGLALAGAGAWAMIAQQAAISGIGAATLLVSAGVRPGRTCHWHAVRALLRTGLPLTASTLTLIGRYRLFAVLTGGIAGPAALGQVHIAFRLVDTARELVFTALWRLMLPILSEQQCDQVRLRKEVDRLLAWSSRLTMPLCAAMAASLPPMVVLLLGPDWAPAGRTAELLVGLMAWLALMFPSGVALIAAGRARQALGANVLALVATVAWVLLLRPATPRQAVLVWCGSQALVSPYALWLNSRVLGGGLLRPLRAGMRLLAISLAGLLLALWLTRFVTGIAGPAVTLTLRAGFLALTMAVLMAWEAATRQTPGGKRPRR